MFSLCFVNQYLVYFTVLQSFDWEHLNSWLLYFNCFPLCLVTVGIL